jgi:hypothetical protein
MAGFTAALFPLITDVVVAEASVKAPPKKVHVDTGAAVAGRWALLIALAVLVVGLPLIAWIVRWIWWVTGGQRQAATQPSFPWGRSLFVGQDNRWSTSKTTFLVWTYTVAAALLSFLVVRWQGHPGAYEKLLHQGINGQFALLIGGPLGAAILAKGITTSQISSGSTAKPPADHPAPAQLAENDTGDADLGDIQYLLFNFIALVFFYGELLRVPQNGMPTIPNVLLGLTSVAAVGYVAKKTLSGSPVISDVEPKAAAAGEEITIATSGIVQPGDKLSLVRVTFGKAPPVNPVTITETTTQGVLLGVDVPDIAPGKVNIKVSVPNGKNATWPGFRVVRK